MKATAILAENRETAPSVERVAAIIAHEPISPKEIRDRYHDRVEGPRTERTVRNSHLKLTQYNLVARSGAGADRSYRTVDEHKVDPGTH